MGAFLFFTSPLATPANTSFALRGIRNETSILFHLSCSSLCHLCCIWPAEDWIGSRRDCQWSRYSGVDRLGADNLSNTCLSTNRARVSINSSLPSPPYHGGVFDGLCSEDEPFVWYS